MILSAILTYMTYLKKQKTVRAGIPIKIAAAISTPIAYSIIIF